VSGEFHLNKKGGSRAALFVCQIIVGRLFTGITGVVPVMPIREA